MSFGISISDVSMLTKLAWKTIQNTRKAGSHYEKIAGEVTSLHVVLRRLKQEISIPESPLHGPRNSNKKELANIMSRCHTSLGLLDKLLERYNSLRDGERTAKSILQRLKFGIGEFAGIEELKGNIRAHTDSLNLYMNIASTGAMGRVEKQMDDAGDDLKEVKTAVNGIALRFAREASTEGSFFTAYTNDDVKYWREFRRRLIKKGFKSRFLQQHESLIHAYLEELGNRGLLDDPECSTFAAEDTDLPRTQESVSTYKILRLASESENENAPDVTAQALRRLERITKDTTDEQLPGCNEQRASSSCCMGTAESEYRVWALPFELVWLGHVSEKTAKQSTAPEPLKCVHWPSWMTMYKHIHDRGRWGKSPKHSSLSTAGPRSANGGDLRSDAVFYAFPATDSHAQDSFVFTTGVGTMAQIRDFENSPRAKTPTNAKKAWVQSWHQWRREIACSTGYGYSQRQLTPERSFLATAWGICLIMEDLDVSTLLADFEYMNVVLHYAHRKEQGYVDETEAKSCDIFWEDAIYDFLLEETEDIMRVLAVRLGCTESMYWEPITKSIVSRDDFALNSNMIGAAAVSFIAKSLKCEMSISAHQDTDVILKGILQWIDMFKALDTERDALAQIETYFWNERPTHRETS